MTISPFHCTLSGIAPLAAGSLCSTNCCRHSIASISKGRYRVDDISTAPVHSDDSFHGQPHRPPSPRRTVRISSLVRVPCYVVCFRLCFRVRDLSVDGKPPYLQLTRRELRDSSWSISSCTFPFRSPLFWSSIRPRSKRCDGAAAPVGGDNLIFPPSNRHPGNSVVHWVEPNIPTVERNVCPGINHRIPDVAWFWLILGTASNWPYWATLVCGFNAPFHNQAQRTWWAFCVQAARGRALGWPKFISVHRWQDFRDLPLTRFIGIGSAGQDLVVAGGWRWTHSRKSIRCVTGGRP